MDGAAKDRRLFLASAAAALGLHAAILLRVPGLAGGADLGPHLRLAAQMGEAPALRNVYPPAFHAAIALLAPWLGVAGAVKSLAWASAAALVAAFRSLQRAAALPDACAALFPWTPYLFALSWCLPKVEAAGYALAFLGLGPSDKVSWGSILEDVFQNAGISQGAWWWLLPPGLCVVLVVLAFTLVGRALEVVVDPRMRER